MTRARSRRGSTAIEFAIVAAVLIPLTSSVVELGLLMWTQTAMQSVASLAARCAALGSPLCGSVPTYAVSLARTWSLGGSITNSDVTLTAVTTCNTASGTFDKVTITVPVWSRMVLKPFLPDTLTVVSCFPT